MTVVTVEMIQEAEKGKVFLILMILCVWSSAQGAVCLNEVTLCDKADRLKPIVNSTGNVQF